MSAKGQEANMGNYKSELDKLVGTTVATISNIIGSAYNEVVGKYLVTEENKIRESTKSLSDVAKQELGRYLSFITRSGKIYEFALGVALRNIGYTPRTLEDLLTRPIDSAADREVRNAARYPSLLLYGMLPNAIQAMYAKRSINSISETILGSLEKELIYLGQYLAELGAKEEDVKNSIQLVSNLVNVPVVIATQMYSAISKIFTPEVAGNILVSTAGTMKELYKKFYDNTIKILETESKKEEEVAKQETKNIKESKEPKQEKKTKKKKNIEQKLEEKGKNN